MRIRDKFEISFLVRLLALLVAVSAQVAHASLPAEYTQLLFLESTGTQYIDTGITFGPTNGFAIDYQVTYPATNDMGICGSRVDNGDTRCMLGSNGNEWKKNSFSYIGWSEIQMSWRKKDDSMGTAYVNYLNSGKWYCRGASGDNSTNLVAQTSTFHVFAFKSTSDGLIYGCCRIRELRISAGINMIMHLVPARRNEDSELGMYDLVNGGFYVNQGTGSFIGGEELPSGEDAYTRLPYLESSGCEHIDTGVVCSDSNGFSITYMVSKIEGHQILCGSRVDGGDTRCVIGSNAWTDQSDQSKTNTRAYVGWNSLLTDHAVHDETMGVVKVNYLNSRTYDCRGEKSGSIGTLTPQTGTFWLFAGNLSYAGQSPVYGRYRVSAFSMTYGDDVVMDMIPAKRKLDGKLGMYDRLNDEFYMNKGQGEFSGGDIGLPEGYAVLDFIESTGTQYIDTGVRSASDVTVDVSLYNAHPSPSVHMFGARTAFLQNALGLSFQVEDAHEGYAVAYGNNVRYGLFGNNLTKAVGDAFHSITFGGRDVKMDGLFLNYGSHVFGEMTFEPDLNIYAFALNNNGSPHAQMPSIRVASLKISRNGCLLRDFLPVMATNNLAVGLYDLQNGVFYGNVGSGSFLAGEIVGGMEVTDEFADDGFEDVELYGSDVASKSFSLSRAGLYRLWFQYKAGTAGTGHSVTVLGDGKSLQTVSSTTTNGWTTANVDFKLNAGGHNLKFQGSGSSGLSTLIDSVTLKRLYEIPSGVTVFIR